MKRKLSILLALLLLTLTVLPALAQGNPESAVTWLSEQVRADGGFSDGFSDASGVGPTTEVIYAAAAAGVDASTWGQEASPLDYLATNAASTTKTGNLARLILVASATGQQPTDFGGVNLVESLQAKYDEGSGRFEGILTEHAYAMLALKAAGAPMPEKAAQALIELQGEAGGWSFDGTSQADTNTTALAIQALVAAGQAADGEAITRALTFLESQQNEDGGFPYQNPSDFGTESDANSTAWVIQGLLAANQELSAWNNPQQFLASLQMENGAFQWKANVEGANFLATAQAVPALKGITFLNLPAVPASQAPTVQAAAEEQAPGTLPNTGGTGGWEGLLAAGILLLLAGRLVRRQVRV